MGQITAEAEAIVAQSQLLRAVERIEFLDKGFSDERNYVLWERGEPVYLLRISGADKSRRRQWDFDQLHTHYERGVRCSRPLEFGVDESGRLCYTLLGYIVGESGSVALPNLPKATQYEIGLDAGCELLKLHELRYPGRDFDWFERRVAKYERKVAQCSEYGLTFSGEAGIQRYIESNLEILRESPVRFQHDDYHPDNLIVRDGRFEGIIDFNRCDWGDPVEDFYKVPWFTTTVSIPFARGQVEGYLANGVPERFWKRYNLLVALNLHGGLVYEHEERTEWWPERLDEIVADHDFAGGGPPRWFVD